jgi:hypothetical protein
LQHRKPPVCDAPADDLGGDFRRGLHLRTQPLPQFLGTGHGAHQADLARAGAREARDGQPLEDGGIVRTHAWHHGQALQIGPFIHPEVPRHPGAGHRIHDDHRFMPMQVTDQSEPRRAQIEQLHPGWKGVTPSEQLDHEGPEAVVAQENIAETDDREAPSTFTVAIVRPAGSRVWQAQAMHGSKECTVRSTSGGRSASAIEVPTREASYGPGERPPGSSRGCRS